MHDLSDAFRKYCHALVLLLKVVERTAVIAPARFFGVFVLPLLSTLETRRRGQ